MLGCCLVELGRVGCLDPAAPPHAASSMLPNRLRGVQGAGGVVGLEHVPQALMPCMNLLPGGPVA